MPKLNEIKQYDINNYSFSKGNALAKNKVKATEEDKTNAANFLNSMMAWYQNVKPLLQLDDEDYMDSLESDDLNPNQTNDELKKVHEDLDFSKEKVTKDTVVNAWSLDSERLLQGVGSLLSRSVMTDGFTSGKDKNFDAKAAYYIKVVEPMMRNDGKLFKEVLTGYANLNNNMGADKNQISKKVDAFYKTQKQFIDSVLSRKPELKAKIQELKSDPYKLEVASGGKKLVADEPEIKLGENKEKASSIKNVYKDQLYRDKNINVDDFRLASKARNLFGSTRLIALGSESTEHSLLNKAVKAYDKYDAPDDLMGSFSDNDIEKNCKKVYMLSNMKRLAKSYADLKTQKGMPSTPAGKDRLAGAFGIMDSADQDLAKIEKEIKDFGKYNSLKEFMNSEEYMRSALNQVNSQIMVIDKFNKGDRILEIEEQYLLAQQAALTIKLNPDKYKDFEQYANSSATNIADRLMHDKDFIDAYKNTLANNKGKGKDMAASAEELLENFKAVKFNENLENKGTAVKNNKVQKKVQNNKLGF